MILKYMLQNLVVSHHLPPLAMRAERATQFVTVVHLQTVPKAEGRCPSSTCLPKCACEVRINHSLLYL